MNKAFQAFFFIALFFISFSFLFFSPGCISGIADNDRLNSTILLNVSSFIDKLQKPIDSSEPCGCMICVQETSGWSRFWRSILPVKLIENDLVGSKCDFFACNDTNFQKTLAAYDPKKGSWGTCDIGGNTNSCAPRYFMVGQGTNPADFSLAQRYCAGRLNMPVIWALQPKPDKPPVRPSPSLLMCYLSRSQMPIVVWDSGQKYIDSQPYADMLLAYNNLSADPKIEGPIMVTTEANIDPYDYSSGKPLLNIPLLQQIKSQIDMIRQKCPKCLSVLALKPTFNQTSPDIPDLCPLDYFVQYKTTDSVVPADPFNCADKYPPTSSHSSRPALQSDFSDKIDIIGVAFVANENANLTTCTPLGDISRHMLYSRQTLANYRKPSAWYAIGIAPTFTATPGCTFSQDSIAKSYDFLFSSISAHVSTGIIGIASYKFIDPYQSSSASSGPPASPLACAMSNTKIFSTEYELNAVSEGALLRSSDGLKSIFVKKILSSIANQVSFESEDGSAYLAWLDPNNNNLVSVNLSSIDCRNFGFLSQTGQIKSSPAYSWFSNCQYYFTNRGFVFTSTLSSPSVYPPMQIYSKDGKFTLTVQSINSSTSDETIFFATDGIKYSARKDGSSIIISDMPFIAQATQQPIMFSSNGAGGYCNAFEGGGAKMLYRSPLSKYRPPDAEAPSPPLDAAVQKQLSQMQCGLCMFTSPMPEAFCKVSVSKIGFPLNACYQYAQIDALFLEKGADPVAMRALAVGESSLGSDGETGSSAPACAIAFGNNSARCNYNGIPASFPKTLPNLQTRANSFCPSDAIASSYNKRVSDVHPLACGLGLFQCIDWTGSFAECGGVNYNPFNPYDSACCGTVKFSSSYANAKSMMSRLRSSNPDIASEVSETDSDWYAGALAAYSYLYGPGIVSKQESKLSAFKKDDQISFVQAMINAFGGNTYGIRWARRYNNAIDVCGNGCPHTDCKSVQGSSSSSGEDQPADVGDDNPDDETFYVP